MTIDHLTRDEVRKIIEPDVNEEGLTIDQFIAEGSEDKLTDAPSPGPLADLQACVGRPMNGSRLLDETAKFITKLEDLLAATAGIDAQFSVSSIGDGTNLAIKPVSFHNRRSPGFPLVRRCDDPEKPVLHLRVLTASRWTDRTPSWKS